MRGGTGARVRCALVAGLGGVVCAALHSGVTTVAAQTGGPDLIVNGDFEQNAISQAWTLVGNTTTALPGWTASGDGVEVMRSYWQPAHGAQSVNLSSNGASEVTQQVSTTAGTQYQLSWFISGNPQCTTPTTRVLSVIWNGSVVAQPTFNVSGHSFQSMGWTAQSTSVTASGDSSTVSFLRAASTDGSCGVAIDDVALAATGGSSSASATQPAALPPPVLPGTGGGAGGGQPPIVAGGSGSGGGGAASSALHGRSTITAGIATPGQAFSSLQTTVLSAALAVLAIVLITFPAQLFNHTFQENYEDIVAFWERHFGVVRRMRSRIVAHTDRRTHLSIIAAVVLLGALLGGLLDPNFGFNGTSVTTFLSTVAATLWGIAVSTFVIVSYRRLRHRDTQWSLRALPAGLPIAIGCVVVSRLSDFEPGYLYGVVCGAVFTGASLAKNEQGHTVAIATVVTMLIALLAWFAWLPVNDAAAKPGALWPVTILDDFLGAVFAGGLVGSVIGMVPLRFLPGGTLAAWHRGVWAVVSVLVTFMFLEIMLNPARGGHPGHAAVGTVVALFIAFGAGSVLFAAYWQRKRRRLAAPAH
ncbi:MAG TPA: FGLLP motif-containing membrane protein [Candidatus Dormibacteraeota bacterium]|nr:FGLLP motif-containing membrane protein [Candidatus Dormibacteraeota bacterium]